MTDAELEAMLQSYARDHGVNGLDGLFSKIWSSVKKVAGPVLGVAAGIATGGLSYALMAGSALANAAQTHHVAVNNAQDQKRAMAALQGTGPGSVSVQQTPAQIAAANLATDKALQVLAAQGYDVADPRIQTAANQAVLRQQTGFLSGVEPSTLLILGGAALLAVLILKRG
jgi:hypothetical protein